MGSVGGVGGTGGSEFSPSPSYTFPIEESLQTFLNNPTRENRAKFLNEIETIKARGGIGYERLEMLRQLSGDSVTFLLKWTDLQGALEGLQQSFRTPDEKKEFQNTVNELQPEVQNLQTEMQTILKKFLYK